MAFMLAAADVNETAYNQIKNWSINELREYVLA